MEVKITTLSENTAGYGVLAEWGLSMLVEADGLKILMDTGLSFSSTHNARSMGIDLSSVDCIVLSHGHIDHTGGLREVLNATGPKRVIAHPDIWAPRCSSRGGVTAGQDISAPCSREELETSGARFTLSREPVRVSPHIITTGEVPMLSDYEHIEDNLFVKEGGVLRPDPLADDLSLVVDTEFGLVVVLGCAHRGVVNTLRHAQKLTGKENVYAVIGGMHLLRASDEQIEETVADLKGMGIQKLGVSHCTGFRASVSLAREFPEAFFLNNAGSRFTLP